jgi:hypothetical protein
MPRGCFHRLCQHAYHRTATEITSGRNRNPTKHDTVGERSPDHPRVHLIPLGNSARPVGLRWADDGLASASRAEPGSRQIDQESRKRRPVIGHSVSPPAK